MTESEARREPTDTARHLRLDRRMTAKASVWNALDAMGKWFAKHSEPISFIAPPKEWYDLQDAIRALEAELVEEEGEG